jgi:hypothetical protein
MILLKVNLEFLLNPVKLLQFKCIIIHGACDLTWDKYKVPTMRSFYKLIGFKNFCMNGLTLLSIALAMMFLVACDRTSDNQAVVLNENDGNASLDELPPIVLDDLGPSTEGNQLIGATPDLERGPVTSPPKEPRKPYKKLDKAEYKKIEWVDLMPKEDFDALNNPPAYITEVEEGSFEDQISDQMQSAIKAAHDDPYQQALKSDKVIPEMDSQYVRIPGFVVPLEFDESQMIYQFFLVPFFGACIHVPPPPPNQIIFVDYPEGFRRRALFDPFWISGKLSTSIIQNEVATSAYAMQMHYRFSEKYFPYIQPYHKSCMI